MACPISSGVALLSMATWTSGLPPCVGFETSDFGFHRIPLLARSRAAASVGADRASRDPSAPDGGFHASHMSRASAVTRVTRPRGDIPAPLAPCSGDTAAASRFAPCRQVGCGLLCAQLLRRARREVGQRPVKAIRLSIITLSPSIRGVRRRRCPRFSGPSKGEGRPNGAAFEITDVRHAVARRPLPPRRATQPRPTNPSPIIAQVEGSGTAAKATPP